MKKFLAILLALVMSFSVALVPAYAAEAEEEADEITTEEFLGAIETTVYLIQDTIVQVHNIVGQIMAVVGEECAFCGEMHEIALEDGAEGELPEEPTEPELPEEPTEPELPEEPTEPDLPEEDDPSKEEILDAPDTEIEEALYYVDLVLNIVLQIVQLLQSAE